MHDHLLHKGPMSRPANDIECQVWYATATDYLAIRAVSDDGAKWHDTYAQWLAFAEQKELDCWAKGTATCRVNLDPSVFVPWCRGLQRIVNNESRVAYAAFVFEDANGASGGDVFKVHRRSKPEE